MNLSGRGTHQVVHVALHCTQNYSNETSSKQVQIPLERKLQLKLAMPGDKMSSGLPVIPGKLPWAAETYHFG